MRLEGHTGHALSWEGERGFDGKGEGRAHLGSGSDLLEMSVKAGFFSTKPLPARQ